MEPFLVSIITVVFNARQDLAAVLDSILKSKPPSVELIVIDGGSTDGTVEYLQSLNSQIDYWLSEPDRGIYDAMNKAVAAARGTYLFHLNAGDRLIQIPYEELRREQHTDVALLCYPVEFNRGRTFKPAYGKGLHFYNTLHHQGTFYRRNGFPLYDLRFRIFADFDINQRLTLAGAKAFIGRQTVAWHDREGISNQSTAKAKAEFLSVIAKNYGSKAVLIGRLCGKWRGLKSRLRLD